MYPTLFKIGDLSVSSYTVMLVIAFLVAYMLLISEIRRKGLSENLCDILLAAAIIGGLVGAKVLFLFQNATLSEFMGDPVRYLSSGYTFLGGLLGAILLGVIIARWYKINFWLLGDSGAPGIILAYAIGRIGCLLVGDDYGIQSNLPWAIAFPNGSPPTLVRVHPTQIYDTILMFLAFIFLWSIRKKDMPVGLIFCLTLMILGVERLLIEFIRTTSPSFIPGLSQAQMISIGIIVVAAYKLIQLNIRSKKSLELQS